MYIRFEMSGHERNYGIFTGWRDALGVNWDDETYIEIDELMAKAGRILPVAHIPMNGGRCWFKDTPQTKQVIELLRDAADLMLDVYDVSVSEIHTEDLEVVWEDEFQVVVPEENMSFPLRSAVPVL